MLGVLTARSKAAFALLLASALGGCSSETVEKPKVPYGKPNGPVGAGPGGVDCATTPVQGPGGPSGGGSPELQPGVAVSPGTVTPSSGPETDPVSPNEPGEGSEVDDASEPSNVAGGPAVGSDAGACAAPLAPPEEPVVIYDVNALPGSVPAVGIEVGSDERAQLDANPWLAEDVLGTFIDGNGTRYEGIELNYRGAYALKNLVESGSPRRNWKVKVTDALKYLGHREWNFNTEPSLRHKLALDLMAFAGVPVPSATHVRLSVNGDDHGLYLQYEDPDNKSWLKDHFGSAAGDLYKAAYDLPNEEPFFAPLTYEGEDAEDYFFHYNKKLNNNGDEATNYDNLIAFIRGLNETPDEELLAWFDVNFDVERFINYLVVANFASHWDSYPYRPKNYWLYQSPYTGRWVFIPWDLDQTFQTTPVSLMPMGAEVSVFFDLDMAEGPENPGEGTERPLVRRMMAVPELRQRYVERYRELLDGILGVEYLQNRIRALDDLVSPYAHGEDQGDLDRATEDMLSFVQRKHDFVRAELDAL